MNERLKELMALSTTTETKMDLTWGQVTVETFDRSKFAELIVQECVREMGRYEFIDVAMREVKEHFGVE